MWDTECEETGEGKNVRHWLIPFFNTHTKNLISIHKISFPNEKMLYHVYCDLISIQILLNWEPTA